jgi:glutathione S-transferase
MEAHVKLYHARGARSTRVRWLLEELELPYHLERVEIFQPAREPEHLRVHPHGQVPAVVDGELALIESGAIVLHYADVHADRGLAPKPGTPERARYYQWILYAVATFDPILVTLYKLMRAPEESRDQALVEKSKAQLGIAFELIGRALGDHDWLLGDTFTAADVALGWDLAAAAYLKLLPEGKLRAYVDRLKARPAFQRAYAD